MNHHNTNLNKIINQIKAWAIAGVIVLIVVLLSSFNLAKHNSAIVAWSLAVAGLVGSVGWWAWTMSIIYQLIKQRIRENHLINHLIDQIRDIKNEIKDHLRK